MQYMSKAVTFRLPDELVERLKTHSEKSGASQAFMVTTALTSYFEAIEWQEEQLAQHREAVERNPAHKNVTLDDGGAVVIKEPGQPASVERNPFSLEQRVARRWACPFPGCDYRAKSPNATCAVHGRKVVQL